MPLTQAVRTHVVCSGHLILPLPTTLLAHTPAGCGHGSCTRWLRIIVCSPKSARMPSLHHRVRGYCYDSAPILLPIGDLGPPVAVCHVAPYLAQPMHDGPGHASTAHHAAAPTLQGPPAVCRPHPQAPLCPV